MGEGSPWEGDPSWKIGLGAMCSPCPDITWESLVTRYPRRANSRRRTSIAGSPHPRRKPFFAGCWPNCTPASTTNSRLTSTGRARNTGQPANGQAKSGKQIERCVISTFQVAESMGFKGDFRQWQHLLRIGD
jgi:hypothetical protein